MTSQWVERTWIRTGGYGRFRGEWVNKSLKSKKKKKWTDNNNLAFKSHGESEDLKVARKFW